MLSEKEIEEAYRDFLLYLKSVNDTAAEIDKHVKNIEELDEVKAQFAKQYYKNFTIEKNVNPSISTGESTGQFNLVYYNDAEII